MRKTPCRGTKSGGMDYSVGIRCSEDRAQSTSRSGRKRVECRGGWMVALLSRLPSYTTKLIVPEVMTMLEL